VAFFGNPARCTRTTQNRCPGGGAHDDPSFHALVNFRAEFLEAGDLGRNVVGLDIDVHATLALHALDLNAEFVRRGLEHAVIAAAAGMIWIDGAAQRLGPEPGRRIDIIGLAVNQQAIEARAMHPTISWSAWPFTL
jgi:hypothetical protein